MPYANFDSVVLSRFSILIQLEHTLVPSPRPNAPPGKALTVDIEQCAAHCVMDSKKVQAIPFRLLAPYHCTLL